MMAAYQATECVYEVDADWVDRTRYLYKNGPITVLTELLAPLAEAKPKVQKALDFFRVNMPNYELLERRNIDQPVAGSELIAHRMGVPGDAELFEAAVFFPIGDGMWVFRVQGPLTFEETCRHVLKSFFDSYEPVEAP